MYLLNYRLGQAKSASISSRRYQQNKVEHAGIQGGVVEHAGIQGGVVEHAGIQVGVVEHAEILN